MSTLANNANVVISMPAESSFTPIQLSIPAHSSQTIDLTPFKEILENKPANTILNKGVLIQASSPITAYYEVSGTNVNPDIFLLKGSNAKGLEFYTPFQTFFRNSTNSDNFNYVLPPKSGFDIVATEDNTTITITPGKSITGHPAGETFTVVLNRGQT